MALASGTRLGHYTILAPIGAGGMGEVWLAEDTTLKRKVALKVLPAAMAADPDRLARFQREAEAVAALTHPNIVTLYSVEQAGDERFLTMELVEGQSLDKLIPRGGLPLAQVLDIGAVLADALVASHEKGIIHRDLKPANVMLTRDRRVKVLDFGLAKLREEALPDAETATAYRTGEGRVLGTVAYMSPEQAEGRPVDARSDLFALGIVLFEMATGERPFSGDTNLSVLSAILRNTPKSVTELRADLPQELARIVRLCLQKDPEERCQTAKDLRNQLRALKADLTSGEIATAAAGQPPLTARTSSRRWQASGVGALTILATAVVLSALGGAWAWSRSGGARPESAVPSRVALEIGVPEGDHWLGVHPGISHDGQRIAYVAVHDGTPQLYVRTLSEVDARPLPGTTGAEEPFFSPDDRSVAFFADHQLKSTAVDGGVPHVICPAPNPRGGAWGDDDVIVFASGVLTGLSRVAATGGAPEAFTFLDAGQGEASHRFPQVLPGATGVLFTLETSTGALSVAGQPAGSKRHVTVTEHGHAPQYAQHHLIFVNDHLELVAAPFDPDGLKLTGPIAAQSERPTSGDYLGNSSFSVARDGMLVYLPREAATRSLTIVTRDGAVQPIPGPPRPYGGGRLSPDGTRIAITIEKDALTHDIWLGDLGGSFLPLTTNGLTFESPPVWSPNGDQLAFATFEDGKVSIFIQPADGRSPAVPLTAPTSPTGSFPNSWLPDGRLIIDDVIAQTGVRELKVVTVGRPEAPRPLLPTTGAASQGMASPDGRWVAYTSAVSGQAEVYVTSLPAPGQIWAVSQGGGGDNPVWARSSQELFFRHPDNRVVAVKVAANGPVPGAPRPVSLGDVAFYDTFPDGRFLVARTVSDRQATRPLVVVLHWTSALAGK